MVRVNAKITTVRIPGTDSGSTVYPGFGLQQRRVIKRSNDCFDAVRCNRVRLRPRTLWPSAIRVDATAPPMKAARARDEDLHFGLAVMASSHQSNSIRPRATEPDTSRRKPSFISSNL